MNPLGDDLLPYLVLAFGGAMAVGTAVALMRPPEQRQRDAAGAPQVSKARAFVFITVGAIAALWALASLLAS
ncbi:MAG TPA: hypothetical protein VF183_06710 [Acidimicrobiales bacterium]